MKFKSDIEVQAGLKDSSGAAGTSGQVLSSTASGVSWVSQSGFVPYTGATGDVNLGIHQLKADSLAVSTSSLETVDAGEIVWNAIDGTFDMGLIAGVTLQAGQEMHIYGKATEVISNGQAVMFAGVQGDHILIAKADAATINANPEYFIGVATNDFTNNQFGYVTIFGNVRGLNTTAYTLGSVLYYDSTTATDGLLTATEPTAPNAKIEVAAVVRVHTTQGILLVRPHVMPKLNDVQDVYAPSPSNNNGLWWNTANSRYENNSISGILGYTAANDANVVKLTGDQGMLGIKSFNHINGSVENFTTRLNYFFDNGIIRSDVTPLETINNLTSQSIFKVDKDGNTTANSFIKIGGNSTQYLKADGSVSTAMNSRIEVNFTATSGQTTFTTPYEVGQIDVYYNGSKLNPSEFTATNGTTVVLAQAATLNAQISIVKYVAALSTTAIRNETTFTATSGQTTFSVNYTVGQLDVFYNGSKLNVSEFTATNGTSVVLGFACVAGESVVFVSYVNQVSGASGTANRVAKFTGAATLGDSQIFDNGTNVGIGTTNAGFKLDVNGTGRFTQGVNLATSSGSVGIGTTSPSRLLDVNGLSMFNGAQIRSTGDGTTLVGFFGNRSGWTGGTLNNDLVIGAYTSNISFFTNNSTTESLRILSNGTLAFNGTAVENNGNLDKLTIGYQGTYGWIQTWNATPLYLNRLGNAVFAGTQRIDNNSDKRIKENIQPIEGALDTLLALNGKKFNMLDEDNILRYGFIAQEVQPHLSDFVTESDRRFEKGDLVVENLMTLESSGTAWAALLVEAIKEQQAQIKELQDEIISLKNK